jgi:hypothetical protein
MIMTIIIIVVVVVIIIVIIMWNTIIRIRIIIE